MESSNENNQLNKNYMEQLILLLLIIVLILGQFSLFIWVGSEFEDIRKELIKSGKIEYRKL